MKEKRMHIKYRLHGKIYEDDLYQNEHYVIEETADNDGIKTVITPKEKLELLSFSLTYNRKCVNEERFYANGYQSWTTSAEYTADDKQKRLPAIVKAIPMGKKLAAIAGDYNFTEYSGKRGNFHSFSYCYFRLEEDVELYGSLNESNAFTVFYVGMDEGKFVIAKDVEGAEVPAGSSFELLKVVRIKGTYDEVFDEYFRRLGIAKPRIDHMAGYTSWYNYFQKIDEKIILRDLEGISKVSDSVNIFQIDDGYETFVGDWLDPSEKFPRGMKFIADAIHEKGFLAGIWLAPFNVQRVSRTANEHPDWLIKDAAGKPILGCAGWGGAYTLDIYNEEVREHIRNFFNVILNEWGYDMVKLDFLYSQCMFPRKGLTRGKIMADAMEFLRECVGDKLLLGCGVPLGSAFGVVDACRISCDVSLRFKDRFYHRMNINNEIPSAKNAMTSTIFRRHLDGRAFCNDPDVFFVRDYNLRYNKEQKKLLAKINHLFGNVLFVSDDVGTFNEEQLNLLVETFEKSNAMIISAERSDKNYFTVKYLENGEKKTLNFSL